MSYRLIVPLDWRPSYAAFLAPQETAPIQESLAVTGVDQESVDPNSSLFLTGEATNEDLQNQEARVANSGLSTVIRAVRHPGTLFKKDTKVAKNS